MRTENDVRGNSRRRFLASATALGTSSFLGFPNSASAEPPPEVSRIRLVKFPASICLAPEYLAEEFLRLEGFSKVEYVDIDKLEPTELVLTDQADLTVHSPPGLLPDLDAGKPLLALAGLHQGCYELIANERVRAIRDLKGKRVAVTSMRALEYYYIATMVAYVGMDPRRDIQWVDAKSSDGTMQSFVDGKADAFLAFPPQPQELRARKIGRVIVDTTQDRPWDEYFCCIVAARKDFVIKNPSATKRAVRAILKAADVCARDPERAARYMVAKGHESRYEVALEVLKSLSYGRWRTYDLEDSLRFFGVRLHEVGLIKTNPQTLIARGSDWRFLNELKKELKG